MRENWSITMPTKTLNMRKLHTMTTLMKNSAAAGWWSRSCGSSSPTASTARYMMSGHISPDATSNTVSTAAPKWLKCSGGGPHSRGKAVPLPLRHTSSSSSVGIAVHASPVRLYVPTQSALEDTEGSLQRLNAPIQFCMPTMPKMSRNSAFTSAAPPTPGSARKMEFTTRRSPGKRDTARSGRNPRSARSARSDCRLWFPSVATLAVDTTTMMKSSTFHPLRRYVCGPTTSPIAITLSTISSANSTTSATSDTLRNRTSVSQLLSSASVLPSHDSRPGSSSASRMLEYTISSRMKLSKCRWRTSRATATRIGCVAENRFSEVPTTTISRSPRLLLCRSSGEPASSFSPSPLSSSTTGSMGSTATCTGRGSLR
mmetsp:Transcript_16934/g.54270  ORF Transcript_16934/g.54270 Transcript_16934/m.54270 type:complete len:372 (-) Transcript_16934:1632-2747(-)